MLEQLKGTIERVTFHSEDSGFCVLKVQAKGQRDLITVVGASASIQAGEFIECEGVWLNNKQYGLQFKADSIKAILPTTVEGMEKYLASGMIKGIGQGFAKRLVKQFGESVFEVIENTPHRLLEVPGLGSERQNSIIQAWHDQRIIRDIMVFLQSYGVSTSRAVRIFKMYGAKSIEKVKENPYRLAQDIYGIGFKTADDLAQKLGIQPNSILRVNAGLIYCLQEQASNGHCGVERTELIDKTKALLAVDESLVNLGIEQQAASHRIKVIIEENETYCFLQGLYAAEKNIAARCQKLLKGQTKWSSWADKKINHKMQEVQEQTQLILSPSQKDAVRAAIKNKMMIITGGPGVGKTTIVNSILKIISTSNVNILLAAPTGRAAKRLSESTGREAKTIHRLLAYSQSDRNFKYDEDNPLEADLIVIDESSMIDVLLMNTLLKAIHPDTALLLVGDVDQLPSVGPGAVLQDLINSNTIPTIKLTEIFRQASTSAIIVNAHGINQGKIPQASPPKTQSSNLSDFYVMHCETPEEIAQKVIQLVTDRIPKRFEVNAIQDIQVLTPMRKGALGTLSLNIELQKYLNPQKEVISKFGTQYGIGDKVIQNVNNYDKDVYNGDIGFVRRLDKEEDVMTVQFNNTEVEYDHSELDELNLAYATTIHKSQGSEYPVVVIPLSIQHYSLLERNLIYTAVTRGRALVIIVAQSKALAMAVNKKRAQSRLTYLKELLMHD
jgi:exodeoxyribonuclease V alpha subunit